MADPKSDKLNTNDAPASSSKRDDPEESAGTIKNAHATGIGSMGRNDDEEKLEAGEKNVDEPGFIKD